MQAALGYRPSYIWRSMIVGREILDLDIRHQVGSGHNIHIWEDKWLPLPYHFKPSSANRVKWPDATVADLILPDTNAWNQSLLEQLFFPYEVEANLQIPLNPANILDQLVWHHSSNGQFNVKSGYLTYQQHKLSTLGSSSVPQSYSKQSVLPLRKNLAKKRILGVNCPHCGCDNETDRHIFYECTYARAIWNQLGYVYLWEKYAANSFYSLVSQILRPEEEHVVSLFFVVTWLIWKARCTMYYEHKHMPYNQITTIAYGLLHECSRLKACSYSPSLPRTWTKPKQGNVTVNVDAGVGMDGETAFGIIIRDHNTHILAAQAGPLPRNISVEHAEIQAMMQGIQLARTMRFNKIEVYTDSRLAYNRITSKEKDMSLVSPLVQHIRLLSDAFQCVTFGFVTREGNIPAHLLAKHGLFSCNTLNWGSKPPYDVTLAVHHDSVSFNE